MRQQREIVATDSGIETAEAVMMMIMTLSLSLCIYTNGFLTTPLAWQLSSYISIMHAKGLSLPLSGKE